MKLLAALVLGLSLGLAQASEPAKKPEGETKDVKVGKTFDLGFGYGIPEKPKAVFKRFNLSKFFIKDFQI